MSFYTTEFRVKDLKVFTKYISKFDIHITKSDGVICLSSDECLPEYEYNDETGEEFEIDFNLEISKHLLDKELFIVFEGLSAIAINGRGKMCSINLMEIHSKSEYLR